MQIFVIDWQDVLVDSSDLPTYLAATYQPLLVSGTSIKTINGQSLLGAGNIAISVDLSGYLPIAGGTMAGNLDMDHYQISNVQAIDSDEITLNGLPVASEQYASNASNLTSGTVSDNRLSSNVPLKNAANTFTQPQVLPAGSAASPALRLGTDTNSGIYQAGSNMVGISIAGSEMFRAATSIVYCFATTFQTYGSILIGSAGDVRIVRNATGPTFETRAAGGLKVANADGSALAAVACSNITVGDNFGSSGRVTTGVGLDWGLGFGNRGTLGAFADGIFGFRTLATTAGFLIDCTTDGTAKLRNRSNTADGSLNLANLTASGNIRLDGTYPWVGIAPTAWLGGLFYVQSGVNSIVTGAGDFTAFQNPLDKSFVWTSGNPTTSGRTHLTIDGATSKAAFGGSVLAAGGNSGCGGGGMALSWTGVSAGMIAGGQFIVYENGTNRLAIIDSIGMHISSGHGIRFGSASSGSGSADVGLKRKASSPGVIQINNGTWGNSSGSIELTNLTALGVAKFTGYPTSLLPAAASNAGGITYDTTLSKHVGCDGSTWNALW